MIVEKILESGEPLNPDWPIHGSTGYDFMDQVAAVLHDGRGEAALTAFWEKASGDPRAFAALARDARREILGRLFPKPRDRLVTTLREIGSPGHSIPTQASRAAMTELLAAMRRYRLYGDAAGFSPEDSRMLAAVRAAAQPLLDAPSQTALEAICSALRSPSAADARQRFQQLSATLAAKAVEDTAFYRYDRLLSRNEVGSDPGRLAIAPALFHEYCASRLATHPAAMLATATHDHKRGEDGRARLAVLSEIPEEWTAFAEPWLQPRSAPPIAIQLMIFQALIGAWPLVFDRHDRAARAGFGERLERWLVKALREAKQQTAWDDPDEGFERNCADFLAALLDAGASDAFLTGVEHFIARIAPAGALNGLAQTLLRLTAPGVPDLYQGTEFWDFSLVDPDNRRAVDFTARRRALAETQSLDALLDDWRDGRIKQALIARVLAFRKRHARLFIEGSYEPLAVSGAKSRHLLAFARRLGADAILVAVPRLAAGAIGAGDRPSVPPDFWQDTVLDIPDDLGGGHALDLLQARRLRLSDASKLERLFDKIVFFAMLHFRTR